MNLNNYNNLLTSGRWSNKYTNDAHILALVGVVQKLVDESNRSSEKSNTSNRYTNKGGPYYIRGLPPWIMEEKKGGVVNKTKDGNEYWWCKEQCAGKSQWFCHKPEDNGKRTCNSSRSGGNTKTLIDG